MEQVEKNDVDISKLFVWGKHFEIVGKGTDALVHVWMRLLGDADINKTRVYSLRKTAELRRRLNDPNSDERIIYIKSIEEIELEELYSNIVLYSMRELTNSANKNVKIKTPIQPKSEDLEDMEKYQKEVDSFPEKYYAAIQKHVDNSTKLLMQELKKESKESLFKRYLTTLINEFCEQEAYISYKNMELYLGCYKDSEYKERFFSEFEEYDNLDPQMKIEFRAAYNTLEVRMDELKKLREATQ
jgi:hypothetical protein